MMISDVWGRAVEVWKAILRSRRRGIPSNGKSIIIPLDGRRKMLWIAEQNAKRRQIRN
jgi:hypothetical protein